MRARHIIGVVFTCVLALGLGYVIGFRHAWGMGVQAEFAARGVLASQMLHALRTGKTEIVTAILESDIDNGLLIGGDFVESRTRTLLPMIGVAPPTDYEQFMSRTASYRKKNPRSVETREPSIKATIDKRVDRYAK